MVGVVILGLPRQGVGSLLELGFFELNGGQVRTHHGDRTQNQQGTRLSRFLLQLLFMMLFAIFWQLSMKMLSPYQHQCGGALMHLIKLLPGAVKR
mmetsp:Transcript_97316/g.167753  ORF Transcript_97316/g.167753 Transcript_97316/m.167753 type:complete len:95 (+) Transcript_97316:1048-1332(+)